MTVSMIPAIAVSVQSTNISDSTSVGRSVITATNAAAARTAIGAGSISTLAGATGNSFAPVVSAATNCDGTPTMSVVKYHQVGTIVVMSGEFTADPTTPATPTGFEFTLPVASNLGATNDLSGTAFCGAIAGQGARIIGSIANNTAVVSWISGDVTSQVWGWSAQYEVI